MISDSCYSPHLYIRAKGDGSSLVRKAFPADAVTALQWCSPRFSTASPFPNLVPIKASLHGVDSKGTKPKRPRTAGPSACSSSLPEDVQALALQVITKAMRRHDFKAPSDADITEPEISTIKEWRGGILLAGQFFCKVSNSRHTHSTSWFFLKRNGQLTQRCHKTGCDGVFECPGRVAIPPTLARAMKNFK